MIRVALLFLAFVSFQPFVSLPVYAQDQKIFVHTKRQLEFIPHKVIFFLEWPSGLFEIQAGVVTPFVPEDGSGLPQLDGSQQDSEVGYWRGGTEVAWKDGEEELQVSALFIGIRGQRSFIPPVNWSLNEQIGIPSESRALDVYYEGLTEKHEELQAMLQTRKARLKMLSTDAEIIGNFTDIKKATEKRVELEKQLRVVELQIERLTGFLKSDSLEQKPLHFVRRKQELTKQVRELAALAKQTETDEGSRTEEAKYEVFRMQDLIDETRFDDVELLERELVRLRREREQLESGTRNPGSNVGHEEYSAEGL